MGVTFWLIKITYSNYTCMFGVVGSAAPMDPDPNPHRGGKPDATGRRYASARKTRLCGILLAFAVPLAPAQPTAG